MTLSCCTPPSTLDYSSCWSLRETWKTHFAGTATQHTSTCCVATSVCGFYLVVPPVGNATLLVADYM